MSNKHNRNGNGDVVLHTDTAETINNKRGSGKGKWLDRNFIGIGVMFLGVVSLVALSLGIGMVSGARATHEAYRSQKNNQSITQHVGDNDQKRTTTKDQRDTITGGYYDNYNAYNTTTTETTPRQYHNVTVYQPEDYQARAERLIESKRVAPQKPHKATLIYPNH